MNKRIKLSKNNNRTFGREKHEYQKLFNPHNTRTEIQGGNANERYHLSLEEYNERNIAREFSLNPTSTIGLNFSFYGGKVSLDNIVSVVAAGDIVLDNNAINYIEIDYSVVPAVVSSNPLGFIVGNMPLYEITTVNGEIVGIVDLRAKINAVAEDMTYNWELDFKILDPAEIVIPYNMIITGVDADVGTTVTVEVNGNPYVLGDIILSRDNMVVTIDIIGLVILYGELV